MNAPTRTQLVTMIGLQAGMNALVNPGWAHAGYQWPRAIWLETAELMDHIGWKWWKKAEPNLPQAKIEMVDIWHFILSHSIQKHGSHAADSLLTEMVDMGRAVVVQDGAIVTFMTLDLRTKIDVFASVSAQGLVNAAMFNVLMQDLEMTWPEMYRSYVAKNVLNVFRQQNGYKAGTYIKEWFGKEDNVALEELMGAYPDASVDELHEALTTRYAAVVAASKITAEAGREHG